MRNFSNFSLFLFFLIIAIIIQIFLGALVRITDSGLSCPDWPLCYGLWFPTKEKIDSIHEIDFVYYQIILEWLHRLNAVLVIAPLTLILLVKCILQDSYKHFKKLMFIIVSILVIQSFIGGFTVIDKNSALSVALHLSLALIFLFLAITTFIFSIQFIKKTDVKIYNKSFFWLVTSFMAVFITMVLGAIVSKSGAALACSNWPLCNTNIFPSHFDFSQAIHMFHRIFAILSAFSIVVFTICIFYSKKADFVNYLSKIPILIVVIQIFIGRFVIFYQASFLSTTIHQFTAVMLFILLSVLISLNICIFNQQKI